MAFPSTPVGTIWQFRIYYAMNAQVLINTFNYRQAVEILDYRDGANQFITKQRDVGGLIPLIQAAISEQCIIDRAEMQPVYATRYATVAQTINNPGDQDGAAPPQNVAQVITRRGPLANRANVGSLHLPPPASDRLLNGRLTVGQVTLLDAVAGQVLQPIDGDPGILTFRPCLWSPRNPLTYQQLYSAFPQQTVRVMTRRTVGRGK